MNSININDASGARKTVIKDTPGKSEEDKGKSFGGLVSDTKSSEVSASSRAAVKNMTMEQYKKYIGEAISQIPISDSNSRTSFAVNISEPGFEEMKNSIIYENWVMGILIDDMTASDPWSSKCGDSYSIHDFGARREDYTRQNMSDDYYKGKGSASFAQKSKESYWVKRAEREEEYIQLMQARSIQKFKANTKIEIENRGRTRLGLYEKAQYSTGLPAPEAVNVTR